MTFPVSAIVVAALLVMSTQSYILELWKASLPKQSEGPIISQEGNAVVVMTNFQQGLASVDLTSGSILWERSSGLRRDAPRPFVSGGQVVVFASPNIAQGIDVRTGNVRWNTTMANIIAHNDKFVAFTNGYSTLYRLEVATGTVWSVGNYDFTAAIATVDSHGDVYIAKGNYIESRQVSGDGVITLWKISFYGCSGLQPLTVRGARWNKIVLLANTVNADGKPQSTSAIDGNTGKVLWGNGGGIYSWQYIAHSNGTVFFNNYYGPAKTFAVDASTMKVLYTVPYDLNHDASLEVVGDYLYTFGVPPPPSPFNTQRNITVFNKTTGAIVFQQALGNPSTNAEFTYQRALSPNGYVFYSTHKKIGAFNVRTGSQVYEADAPKMPTNVVLTPDYKRLFVLGSDGIGQEGYGILVNVSSLTTL